MRKYIFSFLIIIMSYALNAKTVVVDTAGEPMIGAAVFDNDGDPIGIVDGQGLLPEVSVGLYPITLRCMGFEVATVTAPTDTIKMKEDARELTEVVVNSKERPAMYIVCYIRETSLLTDGVDSISFSGQFMADFMLPAYKGAKCKTWDQPRELASKVERRYNNPSIKQNVSEKSNLTLYNIHKPFDKKSTIVPDTLKGKSTGVYSVDRQGGAESIYRLTPESYTVTFDGLAEYPDHKFALPGIFKLLGMSMEFSELWSQHTYSHSDEAAYGPLNMNASAYSLKAYCTGKLFKGLLPNKLPIHINSYVEIYPVEISFHTKEEAKELKKTAPERDITLPPMLR